MRMFQLLLDRLAPLFGRGRDPSGKRTWVRDDERFDLQRHEGHMDIGLMRHRIWMKNVSRTGASCLTDAPLRKEQMVAVYLAEDLYLATVRWTRGLSAGISFEKPLPMKVIKTLVDDDVKAVAAHERAKADGEE